MLSNNLYIDTPNGPTIIDSLAKNDEISCVELSTYDYYWGKIREPKVTIGKIYNIYFVGGILSCTPDQKVLCKNKQVMEIGKALVEKIRIHTCSGLILPHTVENASNHAQTSVVRPVGWDIIPYIVSSVYCI